MSIGLTLAMDGSTYAGSVALIRDREIIAARQLADEAKPGRAGREEHFMPMVVDCLRDGKVEARDLDRVVCGAGPGSFTSLRVAASIAKGIAVGIDRPLFSVPSLMLIVAAGNAPDGRWLAALPAMRDEVFIQLFDIESAVIRENGPPRIIPLNALHDEARRLDAGTMGPIKKGGQYPHARGVANVIEVVLSAGPCDIDTWEPVYGRLAEAQVRWEATHGRPLSAT